MLQQAHLSHNHPVVISQETEDLEFKLKSPTSKKSFLEHQEVQACSPVYPGPSVCKNARVMVGRLRGSGGDVDKRD